MRGKDTFSSKGGILHAAFSPPSNLFASFGRAVFALICEQSVVLDVRKCSFGLKTARRLSHKDIVRFSTEVDNPELFQNQLFCLTQIEIAR